MTGAAKATVTKLLVDLGAACADYQANVLVDLMDAARDRGAAGLAPL